MESINQDFKKVIAILKYLDINLLDPKKKENFETRLIIQKIVFLSKFMGINLKKYNFSLYKNGPYGPDLTRDYYKHNEYIINLQTDVKLSSKEKEILERIRNVVLNHDLSRFHLTDLLEVVSTGYYFRYYDRESSNEIIFRKVKEEKPYISDKIVVRALNLVNKL